MWISSGLNEHNYWQPFVELNQNNFKYQTWDIVEVFCVCLTMFYSFLNFCTIFAFQIIDSRDWHLPMSKKNSHQWHESPTRAAGNSTVSQVRNEGLTSVLFQLGYNYVLSFGGENIVKTTGGCCFSSLYTNLAKRPEDWGHICSALPH